MKIRTWVAVALASMLGFGCGGGGGSDATTTNAPTAGSSPITGVVIDGYIRGAQVFWDCNTNSSLDAGEVSTLTGAGGVYSIQDKSASGCDLYAEVLPESVDEDQPHKLGTRYMMKSVPGQYSLITPFTTIISGRMSSISGLTVDAAVTDLAQILGATSNLLVDYKAPATALSQSNLAGTASSLAKIIETNQKSNVFTPAAQAAYESLKVQFAIPGVKESLALLIQPFIESYASVYSGLSKSIVGDPNRRLTRRLTLADANANASIDAIAGKVNAINGAKFGVPNWNSFSDTELQNFVRQINRANRLSSDAPYQATLNALQAKRNAIFSDAATKLNITVEDEGDWTTFFTNDPSASVDWLFQSLSASASLAVDFSTVVGARPSLKRVPSSLKSITSFKVTAEKFKNYSSILLCTKALDDLLNLGDEKFSASLLAMVTTCGSFFLDVHSDTLRLIKDRKLTAAGAGVLNAVGGLSDAATEEVKILAALKMNVQIITLLHDVIEPYLVDPVTQRIFAAGDIAIQYANASIASMELKLAASKVQDVNVNAAMDLYKLEVKKAWRAYFLNFMEMFGGYYFVVVTGPAIQDVQPGSATLALPGPFTVTGTYLPTSIKMSLGGVDCPIQTTPTPTSTGFTATCTPGGTAGLQQVIITDANTGSVIDSSKQVNVGAAAVVCTPPQVLQSGVCVAPSAPLSGLVGHWSFDGCNANDQSPNANHGTYTGSPVCVPGKSGNALRFNGATDWITVPSSASFPSQAITQSFWFHREGISPSTSVYENYLSKELAFQSNLYPNGNFTSGYWYGTPGFWSIHGGASTAIPTLTDWVHFATTYENSTRTAKTYINGVLVHSIVDSNPNGLVRRSSSPLFIGRNGSANVYHIKGLLDEVRIYDRALSDSEITLLAGSSAVSKYALIANAVGGYFDKTECIKDTKSGLTWEGKTSTGLRSGSNTYAISPWQYDPEPLAYVSYVNNSALCGHADWRRPTPSELASLLETTSGIPKVNTFWLPNFGYSALYMGCDPGIGCGGNYSYFTNFADGTTQYYNVNGLRSHLRLVRGLPPS